MFAQGRQLATENFDLALKAFELALARVGFREDGRRGGRGSGWCSTGPWRLRGVGSGGGLFFKPLKTMVEELEAVLHEAGLLPGPLAVEGGEGGDALSETAEISDEGGDELGEGAAAGPTFCQQALKGLLGVVVGEAGGASGVGEEARGAGTALLQ